MAQWLQILAGLVGIVVTLFCVGAVPFGFKVQGRLSSIETTVTLMAGQRTELDRLHDKIGRLEVQQARLEAAYREQGSGDRG